MNKKYKPSQIKVILDTVLTHALFHMYELEKKTSELNLKMDGTDTPENLQKARVFTLVLTILNDSIHAAHGYCEKMFDPRVMDHYIKNQKIAMDNKLINPCLCCDCKERGYDTSQKVDMESTNNQNQHTDNTNTSEQQN